METQFCILILTCQSGGTFKFILCATYIYHENQDLVGAGADNLQEFFRATYKKVDGLPFSLRRNNHFSSVIADA